MKKFSIWFLLFLILKEARACISSSGAQHSFRSAAAKDEVSEESADDEF